MYKNVLQQIENVSVWPVISFVIFFLFFIILLWSVFTTRRSFIDYMKNLPMQDNRPEKNINTTEP